MEPETKLIITAAAFCAILIGLVLHSDTKGKQALMRELDAPVSYFEAMGIDRSFIEGRIFEQLK